MTHQHQYPAPADGRDWRKLVPGAVVAVTLAGASALSLIHLSSAWRDGAPYRAERAAEAEARRAERAATPVPPVPTGPASDMDGPEVIATGPRPSGPTTAREPRAAAAEQPVRWLVAPVYNIRARDLAPGVTRASVRFNCTVRRDGTLTGCTASETPAGSGLAAVTLPALANARMEPMLIDGRAVPSVATLGVSYERQAAPPPRPAAPPARETGPVTDNAPVSLLAPPTAVSAPPPESTPAGPAPVERPPD